MIKICKVENCDIRADGRGYCRRHYQQIIKHGRILDSNEERKSLIVNIKYCELCNVSSEESRVNFRERFNMTLCERHNTQLKLHGKILDKTFLDPNQYDIYDTYAEIILCDHQCKELARAIIDLEDVERCKQYKWCLTTKNYVISNDQGRMIKLHRFIKNVLDDEDIEIDHENRNPLNNRKYNLRLCSHRNNSRYKGIQSNNTSGVIGVSYSDRNDKWRVYITPNKKQIHLGYFDDIENATIARLKAELQYYGLDFAPQKNLFEKYNIA